MISGSDGVWGANVENKSFLFNCTYGGAGKDPFNGIRLQSTQSNSFLYKLNGNWEYSGFGTSDATCSTNNPLDCTGTQVSQARALLSHHNSLITDAN
jgi:hypothetical protein